MDNRKGPNVKNHDFEKIEKKICISNNLTIHAAQSVLLMSKVEIIPMSKVKSQKYTIKNISVTPLYDSVKILWAACIINREDQKKIFLPIV
jgi:hypothetical protein